jgi:hypothetical protein
MMILASLTSPKDETGVGLALPDRHDRKDHCCLLANLTHPSYGLRRVVPGLGIPPAVVTGRRQLTRFAYLGGLSYVMVSYDRRYRMCLRHCIAPVRGILRPPPARLVAIAATAIEGLPSKFLELAKSGNAFNLLRRSMLFNAD